jgi:hypothetical protein
MNVFTVKGMNNPQQPLQPPAGYTLFATHAASGWAFWVAPADQGAQTCLQQFWFINVTHNLVGRYTANNTVAVGAAAQDPDNPHSVFTADVENSFSQLTGGQQPFLPRFFPLWCTYVASIATRFGWNQIEVVNVANEAFRSQLTSYGFGSDNFPTYVGIMTTIAPLTRAVCTRVGWVFAQ